MKQSSAKPWDYNFPDIINMKDSTGDRFAIRDFIHPTIWPAMSPYQHCLFLARNRTEWECSLELDNR